MNVILELIFTVLKIFTTKLNLNTNVKPKEWRMIMYIYGPYDYYLMVLRKNYCASD